MLLGCGHLKKPLECSLLSNYSPWIALKTIVTTTVIRTFGLIQNGRIALLWWLCSFAYSIRSNYSTSKLTHLGRCNCSFNSTTKWSESNSYWPTNFFRQAYIKCPVDTLMWAWVINHPEQTVFKFDKCSILLEPSCMPMLLLVWVAYMCIQYDLQCELASAWTYNVISM